MGQYFILVNKTKKEYLHPHCCNDGLKMWEIAANGNTMKVASILLRQSNESGGGDFGEIRGNKGSSIVGSWAGDSITLVGDYDKSGLFELAYENYKNISAEAINEYNKFIDYKECEIERPASYHLENCVTCAAMYNGVEVSQI